MASRDDGFEHGHPALSSGRHVSLAKAFPLLMKNHVEEDPFEIISFPDFPPCQPWSRLKQVMM